MRNAVRPDGSSSGPLTMVSLSDYKRKRNSARNVQIDKRCSRKLEMNQGWSDQTEVWALCHALLTFQDEYFGFMSDAYRCFRSLAITDSSSDVETDADSVFSAPSSVSSASSTHSTQSTRSISRYRQRCGRGGRIYVDRTLTADEKEELEKTRLKTMLENPVLEERWKFDPRACEDEKPVMLDRFSIDQIVYRARLLPPPQPRNIVGTTTIRIPSSSLSPSLMRPQINSPSQSRPSISLQTPK